MNRTHTGLPMAASRSANRSVGASSRAGHLAIGFGIRALDIEQHQVESTTDNRRRRGRRGSPRFRWRCADPCCLAPAKIRRVKSSCTIASPPEMVRPPSSARSAGAKPPAGRQLLRGDVGSVLQMPGIGIVAIGAAQQAARHEQHHTQAGPVISGGRLVGVHIAESSACRRRSRFRPARRATPRHAGRAGCLLRSVPTCGIVGVPARPGRGRCG